MSKINFSPLCLAAVGLGAAALCLNLVGIPMIMRVLNDVDSQLVVESDDMQVILVLWCFGDFLFVSSLGPCVGN